MVVRRSVFAEEVAVVEKKIQSYAARMSALETGVAEARRELEALEKAQEASAQELAKYLQELTVIQKRVFGALLAEVGAESVQQLESEVLTRQRERERVQSECRTHIALIEGKQQYGRARVEAIEAQLAELRATEAKNAQKAREVEARLAEVAKVAAEEEETREAILRAIGEQQKQLKDLEVVMAEIDRRIRAVGVVGGSDG